jgi:hypothetical protein
VSALYGTMHSLCNQVPGLFKAPDCGEGFVSPRKFRP